MDEGRYREAERALWGHYGAIPEETWAEVADPACRVRVQAVGEGPPRLWIHGGPNAGSTFAPTVHGVPGRNLVIDRPGCGLSPPIAYGAFGTMRDVAPRVLVGVVDALGLDRVDLVASSVGGAWALWFAKAHPDRVRRIALLGASAFLPGQVFTAFLRAMAAPGIGWMLARMPAVRMRAALEGPLRGMGHGDAIAALPQPWWDWSHALVAHTDTMKNDRALIRSAITWRGMHEADRMTADELAAVPHPVLLYWGTHDPFGGAAEAPLLADALGGEVAIDLVEGGGHLPWLDDPPRASAAIAAFLDASADGAR